MAWPPPAPWPPRTSAGSSTATLGALLAENAGRDGNPHPGPWFHWSYGAQGATDAPIRTIGWNALSRDGRTADLSFPQGRYLPQPGADYVQEVEYIPGLDSAFLSVARPDGDPLAPPVALRLPFRLEKGLYLAGRVATGARGVASADYNARCLIRAVEVDAATPATALCRPAAATARDGLLLTNGDLVLGALDEAGRGYDDAIHRAEAEGDRRTLWRARLFRALWRIRTGDPDAARSDVRQALEVERAGSRTPPPRRPPVPARNGARAPAEVCGRAVTIGNERLQEGLLLPRHRQRTPEFDARRRELRGEARRRGL